MISVDDYHPDNIRVARLLKKYGLEKETWFAIDLKYSEALDQIRELDKMGFNVASHTVNHAFLNEMPIDMAILEMESSKSIIEELIGKKVEWLVYPRGRYNKQVIEEAKKLGYRYARTTKLKDGGNFEKAGVHLSYPREEYKGTDPFDWAKLSPLKHYWFHTFEIEKFNLWEKLEKFCDLHSRI